MDPFTQRCSDPELYIKFSSSYHTLEKNSCANYEETCAILRVTESDQKIVEQVKYYFRCPEKFKLGSIYSLSFTPSYVQAITDLSLQEKESWLKKVKIFLFGRKDPNSKITGIPIDIIFYILNFKILFTSFFPTVKDFQCQVFKQINFADPDITRLVKQQIYEELQPITSKKVKKHCQIQ
jgi:hypothetical protein